MDKIKMSNAEYLIADNSAVLAYNTDEFKARLDGFDNGTLKLKIDFTDVNSAKNIAEEIMNIVQLST